MSATINGALSSQLPSSQVQPKPQTKHTPLQAHANDNRIVCGKMFVVACTIAGLIVASIFSFGAAAGFAGMAKFWLMWIGGTCAASAAIGTPIIAACTNMSKSTDRNLKDIVSFLAFSLFGTFAIAGAPAFANSGRIKA